MMTRKLTALSVVAAFCAALPASADYNNPTEHSDCNLGSSEYGFHAKLDRARDRAMACFSERFGTPGADYRDNVACSWTGQMTSEGLIGCQGVEQQKCNIINEMDSLEKACKAKLERYKAEQARLKRAREAEEEQRKEYQRYLENARRQAGGTDENFATFRQFQKMPRKLARALGGAKPTGAYALSKKFSDVGTKHLQGLQQEAMNRLDGAMSDAVASYGPENPRPTAAQRDRALAHFTNAANRPDATTQLPFAGESAVLGANAQALTMIAEARADGTISEPLANIASVAATATAIALIMSEENRELGRAQSRSGPSQAPQALVTRLRRAASARQTPSSSTGSLGRSVLTQLDFSDSSSTPPVNSPDPGQMRVRSVVDQMSGPVGCIDVRPVTSGEKKSLGSEPFQSGGEVFAPYYFENNCGERVSVAYINTVSNCSITSDCGVSIGARGRSPVIQLTGSEVKICVCANSSAGIAEQGECRCGR